ncbi:hypothetical protein HA402_011132 [Bradysia odoriphaga]|nr:hypothetical protein HA402_011132 [Bradysia odoriphaga]
MNMAEGPSTEPILSDDSNSPDVKAFRKLVCENFSSLFGNNQFTDLRIIVDNKTIKVHKICLICHSPVFKTMLSTDWEESSTNEIRINDFNYETVMQMIEFMYTSKASKLAEMPESILEISQKTDLAPRA